MRRGSRVHRRFQLQAPPTDHSLGDMEAHVTLGVIGVEQYLPPIELSNSAQLSPLQRHLITDDCPAGLHLLERLSLSSVS
jgi:hypothetical protein